MLLSYVRKSLSRQVAVWLGVELGASLLIAGGTVATHEVHGVTDDLRAKAEVLAKSGAEACAMLYETGIDSNKFSLQSLVTPTYVQIPGMPNGDLPRFHTEWDYYTDLYWRRYIDGMINAAPELIYAVCGDLKGYIGTTHERYSHPVTGDAAKDAAESRLKRRFTTEGMEATAVHLRAAESTAPLLIQDYPRDTGETAWDVSAPVYVRGQHVGSFRVGVLLDAVAARQRSTMWMLAGVFGAVLLVGASAAVGIIRRKLRPLVTLSETMEKISTDKAAPDALKTSAIDANNEIGSVTRSFNRMMISLKYLLTRKA